jgi:hypothetical protein
MKFKEVQLSEHFVASPSVGGHVSIGGDFVIPKNIFGETHCLMLKLEKNETSLVLHRVH